MPKFLERSKVFITHHILPGVPELNETALQAEEFLVRLNEWKNENGPYNLDRFEIHQALTELLSSKSNRVTLDFEGCKQLTELPPLPPWLTHLTLAKCTKLFSLSGLPPKLKSLRLKGCGVTHLDNLPSGLVRLRVKLCPQLTQVDHLPKNLQLLTLIRCNTIKSIDALPPHLTILNLIQCNGITSSDHLPDGLNKMTITECRNILALDNLPLNLELLRITRCHQIRKFNYLPACLKSLVLHENNKLRELGLIVDGLNELRIINCPQLTVLPSELSENSILTINTPFLFCFQQESRLKVAASLNKATDLWRRHEQFSVNDVDIIKEYFLSLHRLWGCSEAKRDSNNFAKKQLLVIEEMNDPEIREACLALAVAGMADCHDNALAIFLQMQEKILAIGMAKPGMPAVCLIYYGFTLENQHRLAQLIDSTPLLKSAINTSEGTEVDLLLRVSCHELNVPLPVPVTSMSYPSIATRQFFSLVDEEMKGQPILNEVFYLLKTQVVAPAASNMPTPEFLAAQPFWQNYLNLADPGFEKAIANINDFADTKQDDEFTALRIAKKTMIATEFAAMEIDSGERMHLIENERQRDIAHLYFKETKRLLKQHSSYFEKKSP